ncbi:glutathione S-transferase family protein [Roseovarius aestuariivivens]|uniref:glutathione S-transferase family protein n=1 Tax=Roseovarius aestuariivivens TaxID=1888910 RepID=UPI00108214B8|nr:glutathione S-transferase family protein [Roseovarius aestuariivivens]
MADKPVLYGFDGSTYVRTVRMVLKDNGIDYDQVPVNVLEGETRQPDHLARHPFGKVPVLDIDDIRLRETAAICQYLHETGKGDGLVPEDAKRRAKMNEAIQLIVSYGYDALVGVAGYHLFPHLVGGQNEDARRTALENGDTLIELLMENADPWICGTDCSLADYFLGPIIFYVSLTTDADKVLSNAKLQAWWDAMQKVESFKATEPDLD